MKQDEFTFEQVKTLISLVPLFKGWPIEMLQDKPAMWAFDKYRLQDVVVKDSLTSEWIYIITSGTMSVMKRMVDVKPKPLQKLATPFDVPHPVPKHWRKIRSGYERAILRKVVTPPQQYNHLPDMLIKLDEHIPGILKPQERMGIIDYDHLLTKHKLYINRHAPPASEMFGAVEEEAGSEGDGLSGSLGSGSLGGGAGPGQTTDMETRVRRMSLYSTAIHRTSKGVYVSTNSKVDDIDEDDDGEDDKPPTTQGIRNKDRGELSTGEPSFFLPRLVASGAHMGQTPKRRKKKKVKYTYVFMQTLEKGQVFGHLDIAYPDQPSLILVSNGSEAVRINKALFKEHADINYKVYMQSMTRPYPDEASIRSNFQQTINIQHYHRVSYLDKLKTRVNRKRKNRKQYPVHAGLHNFRARLV